MFRFPRRIYIDYPAAAAGFATSSLYNRARARAGSETDGKGRAGFGSLDLHVIPSIVEAVDGLYVDALANYAVSVGHTHRPARRLVLKSRENRISEKPMKG